jgi:GNAT superfamily N-acetyltransferase
MLEAFGWEHKPENPARGERVYAYIETDATMAPAGTVIGWGSLHFDTTDAADTEAMVERGVFPQFQRRGYRLLIFEDLCQRAKALGAVYASVLIYKTNKAHYDRTMREAHTQGSLLRYAGDCWYPEPGYGYFVRPLEEGANANTLVVTPAKD